MAILVPFIVIILLILINGLFVAAEFAIIGVRQSRMAQLAEEGNRTAALVRDILADDRKTNHWIATAQLGITLASLGLGMYAEPSIAHLIEAPLHDRLGLEGAIVHTISFFVALSFVTYLHVVIGEMVPKSLSLQKPERAVFSLAGLMRFTGRIFSIPVATLNRIGLLLLGFLRVPPPSESSRLYTADELELIITESSVGGQLEEFEQQIAANIFDLAEHRVSHVMTHRTAITAIPITASEADIRALVATAPYSRVPVYQKNIDYIIGLLHIKDFVRQQLSDTPFDLRSLMRDIAFVPETLPVDQLLARFKGRHMHMAIVMDEHGGTLGLVTLEDLIEEVVGEVYDEFDLEVEQPITLIAPGHVVAQGTAPLTDVKEYVPIGEHGYDVQTIGGLVLAELGRRPSKGDEIHVGSVTMRVDSVERLAIKRVSIRFPPDTAVA
jgi:CBS domain containing-hemolysin-like protein